MEKVIKIAIENGYLNHGSNFRVEKVEDRWYVYFDKGAYSEMIYNFQMVLDPLFWQALGKGLGWMEYGKMKSNADKDSVVHLLQDGWKAELHSFIDHLIEGKDINSFFEDLCQEK